MDESKLLDTVLANVIPLIIGLAITFLGRFVGFIYTEIITPRFVAILVLTFLVGVLINVDLAGWITLTVFLLLCILSIIRYLVGPKRAMSIVFSGFYDVSSKNGKFCRTGASNLLDAQFSKSLIPAIERTGVTQVRPISVVTFKPPALIHSWIDHEHFDRLMRRYAKRTLGVVWGTLNADGQLNHLDIKLNVDVYSGHIAAEEMLNDSLAFLNGTDVNSEDKVRFIAETLGAFWGNAFSNDLAENNEAVTALEITKASIRLFESALTRLETQVGVGRADVTKLLRSEMLPNIAIEEARNRMHAGQVERPKFWEIMCIGWPPLIFHLECSEYNTRENHPVSRTCLALLLTKEEYGFSREVVLCLGFVRLENHPVSRDGCHPSFVRRGAFVVTFSRSNPGLRTKRPYPGLLSLSPSGTTNLMSSCIDRRICGRRFPRSYRRTFRCVGSVARCRCRRRRRGLRRCVRGTYRHDTART